MSKEDKIVFCTGGGCTAKLGAGALSRILEKLPRGARDPSLLVGYDSRDDAAVYRITDDIALVQTVDFFPPMVDDPYTFGQIAAANALSDVYAMGGEVKTALNLVCFPESMDLNILGEILRGGAEKVAEAGGSLAGGHFNKSSGRGPDLHGKPCGRSGTERYGRCHCVHDNAEQKRCRDQPKVYGPRGNRCDRFQFSGPSARDDGRKAFLYH